MAILTVITVVKDDAEGLARTLASLTDEQDLADIEFVIIDGSAARSAIPQMIGHRDDVTYAWCTPQGVYPAMNDGLARATGEYCYFLNAGDTLAATGVLRTVTDALREHRPLWAFGRVRFLAVDGTVMPEPEWDYATERRHWFARGRFPAHQGVVVSTAELRAQGGFDPAYRVAADYASILRFAAVADPLPLRLTLAEFTVGGLSTQQWRLAQREFHRARREILAPAGLDAARERAYTLRSHLGTIAYRALWAPGRPLHSVRARLRT